MDRQQFSFPDITPLVRLSVRDSLRINAERWLLAHDYHRHRQNTHYQSLWEPGIVCGLGVKVIDPPNTAQEQFRDERWIEIEPGIAIDVAGNPIIVPSEDDRTYRIAAPAPIQGFRIVQIVISYVDPRELEPGINHEAVKISEKFRFDQRINRAYEQDIELCRISLAPGMTAISLPTDPFKPSVNELDWTHRRWAQLRPKQQAFVGMLNPSDQNYRQWMTLLMSTPHLINSFQGKLDKQPIDFNRLERYSLLVIPGQTLLDWREGGDSQLDRIRQYLECGGCLYSSRLPNSSESNHLRGVLSKIAQSALRLLKPDDLIRTEPFHFGQLPLGEQDLVEMTENGHIILGSTSLVKAWASTSLSREQIRATHELGINILHFAWWRRHYQNLKDFS